MGNFCEKNWVSFKFSLGKESPTKGDVHTHLGGFFKGLGNRLLNLVGKFSHQGETHFLGVKENFGTGYRWGFREIFLVGGKLFSPQKVWGVLCGTYLGGANSNFRGFFGGSKATI